MSQRLVAFRRKLHQHPEIGLDLPITRRAVEEEISDLGLNVRRSTTTSALVAELVGRRDGPAIILRADMDALPLHEDTGLDFASRIPGHMHACGHDAHTAMLAGAARLLSARRDDLAGRVIFLFQAGEEGYHGARYVMDEGLLDLPAVAGAFALHVAPQFTCGTVNLRSGPILAAMDNFRIVVTGRGGHASAPHRANDPIPAAGELVSALHVAFSRTISAFDPVVLTIGKLSAGTTFNVIPATAELAGTIRTLSATARDSSLALLHQVAGGVAAAHGLGVETTIFPGYPATVNDDESTQTVRRVAGYIVGDGSVVDLETPMMGAEDFSYVLSKHRGALAFLGACPRDRQPSQAARNHSNVMLLDESALPVGVAVYAGLALDVTSLA